MKTNFNKYFFRETIEKNIKNKLIEFEKNKYNLLQKRGFYIYGSPGSGKTTFIKKILKKN